MSYRMPAVTRQAASRLIRPCCRKLPVIRRASMSMFTVQNSRMVLFVVSFRANLTDVDDLIGISSLSERLVITPASRFMCRFSADKFAILRGFGHIHGNNGQ